MSDNSEKFNSDCWTNISEYQKLSEKFIEKYSDKLCWFRIAIFQELSEEFIIRHSDKLAINVIDDRQVLSRETIDIIAPGSRLKTYSIAIERKYGPNSIIMYIKNDRPDIIHILNFKGTKKEAIAKIKEDYRSDPDVRDAHIKRINRCFKKANK